MTEKDNAIPINSIHRIILITLSIVQYLLFFLSLILLTHYHTIKLPFIPYQSMLQPENKEPHYIFNGMLYIMFWVQHILMASIKYKLTWFSLTKKFVIYDRYVFNVISGLTLWLMYSQVKPSYEEVFVLPLWLCFPLNLWGFVYFFLSFKELGKTIFVPFSLGDLINGKKLVYQHYQSINNDKLKADGVYGYSRNPMQLGFLLIFTFGNGIYTIDRLIFVGIMDLGILIGVYFEQKRMKKQFSDYQNYVNKVKNRFIPFI